MISPQPSLPESVVYKIFGEVHKWFDNIGIKFLDQKTVLTYVVYIFLCSVYTFNFQMTYYCIMVSNDREDATSKWDDIKSRWRERKCEKIVKKKKKRLVKLSQRSILEIGSINLWFQTLWCE